MDNKKLVKNNSRLRFTYEDDLAFFKECIALNPFNNSEGWERIQKNLEIARKKTFQIRTLKHHLQLLLEIWLKKEKEEKIRSGTEEPYSEKDILLQEISSLCKEFDFTKKKRPAVTKEQRICELGKQARNVFASSCVINNDEESETEKGVDNILLDHDYVVDECVLPMDAAEEFAETQPIQSDEVETQIENEPVTNATSRTSKTVISGGSILGPARKKIRKKEPVRKNALAYSNEKSEREARVKEKELQLEERKIRIDERRSELEERRHQLNEKQFEFEANERRRKLQLEQDRLQTELQERRIMSQLLESQQKIIDTFLNKELV